MKLKSTTLLSSFSLAAVLAAPCVQAASQTWDGGGTGSGTAWLTGTNWAGDPSNANVPGSTTATGNTDIATFVATGTGSPIGINMNFTGNIYYLGAIELTGARDRLIGNSSSTGGTLLLNGATVNSVANTILRNTSANLLTIVGSQAGIMGLALGNSTNNVIQITSTGGITISSIISGTDRNLTLQGGGAGNLILTGANTYSGTTTIAVNNTLRVGNNGTTGTLGSGSVVNNGTLVFSRTDTTTFSGTMTGTGYLVVGRGGVLTLASGANVTQAHLFAGDTTGASLGAGTFTVQNGASLTVSNNFMLGNQANQNGTVNQTGGTVNLTSSTAVGSNSGDIRIGHWSGLTGAYNLSGGTLNATSADTTVSWDGTGLLAVSGGTANLRGVRFSTAAKTIGGTLNLSGGTLNIGAGGIYDGSTGANTIAINFSGGTLGALTAWSSSLPMTLTNTTPTINTTGGNISLSGVLSSTGALTKTGSGTLTLSTTNSYTGGTTVSDGTLTLGHATNTLANAGAVNVNGGILALGTNTDTVGAVTISGGSITGTGTAAQGVLTGTSYALTDSGTISAKLAGAVTLTKTGAGTATLSSANVYTGATAINDGTLRVNGSTSTSSAFTVAAAGTLAGNGTVGGTLALSGKVAPGQGDVDFQTLNVTGTTTLNDGASFQFNLPSTGTADQLAIGGVFTKGTGTTYQFDFMGSTPTFGTPFVLATFSSSTGFLVSNFAATNLGAGGHFGTGEFTLNPSNLTWTAVPEASNLLVGGLLGLGMMSRRRKQA